MGTKNEPGQFDCYANAKPDEPMFVLLGRDPTAGLLVALWCTLRQELGNTEPEALAEAEACGEKMEAYADALGKGELRAKAAKLLLGIRP